MSDTKPQTIDATPTWKGVLRLLLAGWTDGTDAARTIAITELDRMANLADSANELRRMLGELLDAMPAPRSRKVTETWDRARAMLE